MPQDVETNHEKNYNYLQTIKNTKFNNKKINNVHIHVHPSLLVDVYI